MAREDRALVSEKLDSPAWQTGAVLGTVVMSLSMNAITEKPPHYTITEVIIVAYQSTTLANMLRIFTIQLQRHLAEKALPSIALPLFAAVSVPLSVARRLAHGLGRICLGTTAFGCHASDRVQAPRNGNNRTIAGETILWPWSAG